MEFKKFMEALKGNQHKLDKNKNGKLDAHDFKLLRQEEDECEYEDEDENEKNEKEMDEAVERVARADYKQSPSGRKAHKEITFKDGSPEVKEETELEERTMTDAEMKKREDIVKGMKKNVAGFKAKYGERAKDVMYATATKMAMKEESELEEGYVVRYNNPKSEKHGSEKHFNNQSAAQKHADRGNSVDKIGGKYTVHKTNEKGHDMKEEVELDEADQRIKASDVKSAIKNVKQASAHTKKMIKANPTEKMPHGMSRHAAYSEEFELDESVKIIDRDSDLDQEHFKLSVNGKPVHFVHHNYEGGHATDSKQDIHYQVKNQLKHLSDTDKKKVTDTVHASYRMKEEFELDEAIKLNSKVTIHDPGKSHHGKVGYVGEIRHGAYKGAPKTYTVDYDHNEETGRSKSIQLDKKNIKQVKEEVGLDEAVESGNKGYGYHGQHESDVADKKYSAMHAKVKKVAGEAGHLRDAKKPNVMVKHYLDSRHGRHLAGNEHDHEYIKKDFGKFKKAYKESDFAKESVGFDEEGNLVSQKVSFSDFLNRINEQLLEYETKNGVYRHKGSYGSSYQGDDDEDDDKPKKPAEPAVKRGRGRPAGSKSGANQKVGSGKSYGGIAHHTLNLPTSK